LEQAFGIYIYILFFLTVNLTIVHCQVVSYSKIAVW